MATFYKDITSHSPQIPFQEAIKQSKNNNSQGPDKLNIRHLKHIGPLGLAFLTSLSQTTSRDAKPTQHRNHTSSQRQFKTGVPQVGVLSPTLFNIYAADIPPPRAPVQVMAYADDITITSTHTSTSAAKK